MALKNRLQVLKNVVDFDEKLQFFSNGTNGETVHYYDDKGVKNVFDVHHYGDGGTLYFKKKKFANVG